MGGFFSRLFRSKSWQVLMLGLDSAGKTTILYKLRYNLTSGTIPTHGFNYETIQFGRSKFNVWDIGGQERMRHLWSSYFQGTTSIIYVIDCADRKRISDACHELHKILEHQLLHHLPVLIFANKQDLPGAVQAEELQERLELDKISTMRSYWVQGSCAITGVGIKEGFDWLVTNTN